MRALREEVRDALADHGWPSAAVRVIFDSAHRVTERGRTYFNE